ncbi:MAG: maleylacetoacetate isomerase [Burkholderiales bacterium]|nr:maleylacetoacetate isomerase [Burkholderiales bacterium]
MLQLYDYFRSSAAFRVRLALNYKNLKYNKNKINLLDGDQLSDTYTQINPNKLVPVLMTENNKIIRQSLAIIEYLEEVYPDPALLPQSPLSKVYVRALAMDVACDIHPLNNLRVLNYLKTELNHDQETVNKWYAHWIVLGLTAIENSIKNSEFYTGKYCYNNQFTLADICLLPQLVNARRFHVDISGYPTLLAIEKICQEHEYVLSAYPDRQV